MKARVKSTGEIVEISEDCSYLYAEHHDKSYNLNELEFLDVLEKSFPKDTPDYWTRLEHQYAGQFMQAMLSSSDYINMSEEAMADASLRMAHALVEKYKKEERK